MAEGRIIKAISGFYYVKTNNGLYQCQGRGVFRKKKITPLVGDFVSFDIRNSNEGYITEIMPRTNELIRPPIANITQALIVSAATKPQFSPLLLDRFLVLIESKHIRPLIVINKMDLVSGDQRTSIKQYQADYEKIGYPVLLLSAKEPNGIETLKQYFANQVTVVAGQSGVGKSSILNVLKPALELKTATISKSLGRGKHTTRHVELIDIAGGLVADTPGFSALDFNHLELTELASCFPELKKYQTTCKFRGCLHSQEPNCNVKKAVETSKIARFRYEHYLNFLDEIKSRKPRY